MSDQEKDFDERLESAKKEHFDGAFNKMRDEMEILKVRLEETQNRNEDLKLDILDLKRQNEKLNEKSVEDSLDMADISQQNEKLVKMVAKGSTLDEVANSTEVPVVVVEGKLDDDPMLTKDVGKDVKMEVQRLKSLWERNIVYLLFRLTQVFRGKNN